MKFILELPIKAGDEVYIIEHSKIGKYFVKGFRFNSVPTIGKDISESVIVQLNRYNDGKNFYNTEERLSQCFLSREELINQL